MLLTSHDVDGQLECVLHRYRLQSGLTQKELADLSRLSIRTIRDLERGWAKKPRRETIRLLADALRLRADERMILEAAVHGTPSDRDLRSIVEAEDFPPPTPMNAMTGRAAEFAALSALFTTDNRRLVSIVGAAGAGKTRMALEIAGHLHAHHHCSVLWIGEDEQAGRGPGTTSSAAAQVHLRVRQLLVAEGDHHHFERLDQLLRGRNVLLVVDGQDDRWLAMSRLVQLLYGSSRLRIIVTSDTVSADQPNAPFTLAPLPVPAPGAEADLAALRRNPAMQLLLSGLKQMSPGADLTVRNAGPLADVCRMLDGLPAALNLAARWTAVLSPQQLAEQVTVDPMILLTTPGATGGEFTGILRSLARAAGSLTGEQAELLESVAMIGCPWSIQDAAALVGRGPTAVAKDVYDMLVRGLLRRSDDSGRSVYSVLNMVKLARDSERAVVSR